LKFPATYSDLVRGGYTFLRRRHCSICGEEVIFFLTPARKKAPFVLLKSGRYLSHFALCGPGRRAAGKAQDSQSVVNRNRQRKSRKT
jgi:hypothetical protein